MAIANLGVAARFSKRVSRDGTAFAALRKCQPAVLSLLALFLAPVVSIGQPPPLPITWTPIGPHHIPGSLGSVASGKLQALAVYYNNPDIMYAGGGLGSGNEGPIDEAGAFKTTDGGLTWAPINSGLTDSTINTLWVNQADPNLALAGTEGTGIFRTTDGGQTWSLSVNLGATSVIISASGGLLAATAAGIAQSTDSGVTWSVIQRTTSTVRALAVAAGGQSIAGLDNGAILIRATATAPWQTVASNPGRTVWAVAWDPTAPSVAYAILGYGPTGPALMVTRDTGVTWSAVALPAVPLAGDGGPPPQAITTGSGPAAVYVASGNPGALFSTSDGGQSWTTIPTPQVGTWDNRAIYPVPGQGALILASDQGLYKTVDGGKTWASISGSVYSSILTGVAVSGSVILTAVQDFSPILSFDRGNTWLQPVWDNHNPPIGEDGAVVINPVNPNYCYAYTISGYQYSTDGCRTFLDSNAAKLGPNVQIGVNVIAVDPMVASTVYAASQTGVFKSVDWGATMSPTNWGLLHPSAIAVQPSDSNTIFVGTLSGLYRTHDAGITWTKLNLVGASGYPSTIAINSANPNVVLVGLSQGPARVLKSTDGGSTFQLANAGLSTTPQNPVDVLAVRFNPDQSLPLVALATRAGIYISNDLGDHWLSANGDSVPTYFADVAWDGGFLYAATLGEGVLRTPASAILASLSPPVISLSNTQLQFWDYVAQSSLTPPQAVGVSNIGGATLSFAANASAPWINITSTLSGFTVSANPAGLAVGPHSGTISVTAPGATNSPQTVSVTLTISASAQIPPASAARFVPITPCRIADTRNATGPFGGPAIPRQTSRDFAIPNSACGIPSTAVAYSLNVAVVPSGPLGFLTLWPAGQPQPLVATLNSIDGRVKSNAAIVPAGLNGAISVFVTDATDVILDINGYFVPASNESALAFYPITPCRVADTRNATAPLGGPSLAAQSTRSFPILASSCGVPASAQAYSLNFAAVPKGPTLGFMTAWPAGQQQPLVASLNDPTGTVLSNAVIVPAGANGAVSVFTTDATDLVIDINGYFAPLGAGGLSLYTVAPCRVIDTRLPVGSPPFNTTRDVNVTATPCSVPATAQAFVFNATVVPPGFLGYITMWPQGQTQPLAAVLNAYDAAVTNNMAIVPTTTGSVSVFPAAPTHLVLDLFGYFAP